RFVPFPTRRSSDLVGASSPWVAQWTPRFLFPALAAAGAVLVVFSFVSSLARFVRRARGERRFGFFPVVVNVVATMFLVILPLMHLVRAMTAPADEIGRASCRERG